MAFFGITPEKLTAGSQKFGGWNPVDVSPFVRGHFWYTVSMLNFRGRVSFLVGG